MQTAVILRFVRKETESEFVMQTESEGIEKYESLTILYFFIYFKQLSIFAICKRRKIHFCVYDEKFRCRKNFLTIISSEIKQLIIFTKKNEKMLKKVLTRGEE